MGEKKERKCEVEWNQPRRRNELERFRAGSVQREVGLLEMNDGKRTALLRYTIGG